MYNFKNYVYIIFYFPYHTLFVYQNNTFDNRRFQCQ